MRDVTIRLTTIDGGILEKKLERRLSDELAVMMAEWVPGGFDVLEVLVEESQ